ncbi:hypothetical protein Sjap_016393 [Stephania japonica]|uniref:Uncharacterized protein n=1 Tax=Stephania japonica TaxID=461633 RepID=A0AAP0NUY3_9MAGN
MPGLTATKPLRWPVSRHKTLTLNLARQVSIESLYSATCQVLLSSHVLKTSSSFLPCLNSSALVDEPVCQAAPDRARRRSVTTSELECLAAGTCVLIKPPGLKS